MKWKLKRQQPYVDISDNSWRIVVTWQIPSKGKPVGMIRHSYQFFAFYTSRAQYRTNSSLGWLLDKNNIKGKSSFKNCVDNQIVFPHILWKYFDVFSNHELLPFMLEQINCFLLLQSFWYSFECYSLLKQYLQNGHIFKSVWWSPLQLIYLNMWGQGFLFLVSSRDGLILLFALQHHLNCRWCSNL